MIWTMIYGDFCIGIHEHMWAQHRNTLGEGSQWEERAWHWTVDFEVSLSSMPRLVRPEDRKAISRRAGIFACLDHFWSNKKVYVQGTQNEFGFIRVRKIWLNCLNSDWGTEGRVREEQWPLVKKVWLWKYGEKLKMNLRRSCNSLFTTMFYKLYYNR